ncbi:S-layer homology domain-containing protein [Chamaesiphon sp.]|uniref:S-layer homology domain-containing protein n=1 Tax=Chamaesiphon sp. TaxID=2814140 RepID=UPI003592EBD2
MIQHKQQSNLQHTQIDRIVSLLTISIFMSVSIVTNANAEPTVVSYDRLDRVAATSVAGTLREIDKSTPATPAERRVAQASDITGNWAEPFIKALVEKDIIKGYPDGTFRPDRAVTRAEYAALLNKAFTLQPVRAARKFQDVPNNYWASEVIQKAYQSGFLAGYPNGTFAPDRNITRIQSLVAVINGNKLTPTGNSDTTSGFGDPVINGSKLTPTGNLDLNSVFGDAAQVPSYGQNVLIAATQRCAAVSVEYDSSRLPGGNFGPNTVATRADVAAYIHQILVSTGKLSAVGVSSPANKYIASCPQGVYVTTISDTTPRAAVISADEAIAKLSVVDRLPELTSSNVNIYPVGGLNTPSAFGASWGNVFVGTSYQSSTRAALYLNPPNTGQSRNDGAVYLGVGLGDARNFLGLETVATSYSTANSGLLKAGSLSFKLHKQFGDNFAIAGGYENAIPWSNGLDGGQTGYGVATLVLNPDPNLGFFSNTTISVGGGAGRFRNVGDIRTGKDAYGVFGSLGTRLSPNFSLVADWTGQDLGVGVPITIYLSDSATIQLVPSVVDLVNKETGGARFVLNGGLGFRF